MKINKSSRALLPLITLLLFIASCLPQQVEPAATNPVVQPSTLAATATFTPPATSSPMPLPSETPEPSLTAPPTPTAIPASWRTYTSPVLDVTFRYPESWQVETPTRYRGLDGFFDLSTRTYPASVFDSLGTACMLEANRVGSSIYGAAPMLSYWQQAKPEADVYACTVEPEDEDPASDQAVLFARYPPPAPPEQVLVLRTDAAHYGAIASTLRFISYVTPTPSTPGYYDSPACSVEPPGPPASESHFAGLTITEYAIATAACNPRYQYDGFGLRMAVAGLRQKMYVARSGDLARQIAEDDRLLAPFDYHLVGSPPDAPAGVAVYQGQKLLASGITRLGPVSVKADGTDFVFWIQDTMTSQHPIELRRDSLYHMPNSWENGFNTVYAGENLVSYEYGSNHQSPVIVVKSNSQPIFSLTAPLSWAAVNPVIGLWSWQGHWLLEQGNVVVQDGVLQNLALGYDEMFDWHLVNGSPFFFFSRGGSFGLSYAGQELPQRYDDVLHGQLCCSWGVYNIYATPTGAWFYALKDGVWRLVSVLIDEGTG